MAASFPTILNRITFITRLILNNETLTLNDIDSRWRDSVICDGSSIDQKQLQRDRIRILELYGIDIRSRRIESGVYYYFVKNRGKWKDDSLVRWTMNTLAMAETLAGYSSLRDRVFFEDYSPDPYLLPQILQAMKSNRQLSITYKKFDNVCAKVHSVDPYFIKDYQHRIYLVARNDKYKNPAVFALDRILAISTLETKFKMPKDLTAEEFFEDCYGVFHPDDMKTELITLRAYGEEMYYMNTKPLHRSQMPIGLLDLSYGFCDFQLHIKPTNDFLGFLLSRAERIELISPVWLRKKLQSILKRSAKMYDEIDTVAYIAE